MNNIIIIDDDVTLTKMMKSLLESQSFQVFSFVSAEQFLNSKKIFDECIYIIDAGLPGLQGDDVIRSIRFRDKISPVFMISGDEQKDKINRGLMSGADDYLVKPFDPEIFLSKITNAQKKSVLILDRIKDAEIKRFASTNSLERNGVSVKLTSTQFRILCLLLDSDTKKRSRIDLVSGTNNPEVTARTIDVHIHGMRPKVEKIGIVIQSIRGYGYQISYL